MSVEQNIIHEDVNQNKTENIVGRECDERTRDFSKQVNEKNRSYKDALVRSNCVAHNSILS